MSLPGKIHVVRSAIILLLAGFTHVVHASTIPTLINGGILLTSKQLDVFTLKTADGQYYTRKALLGHWTFIYFGYTHCPDACPITLHQLKVLQKRLHKTVPDQKFSFVMVTVDPERDTPQIMQEYVNHFNPAFHGLSGDPGEIKALAKQLLVQYERGEKNTAIGYVMYHTDDIEIVNPKGEFVAAFFNPHYPRDMLKDFLTIQKFFKFQ